MWSPPVRRPVPRLAKAIPQLADELRVILATGNRGDSRPLIAAFVARNGLTHRDVDSIMSALANDVAAPPPAVASRHPGHAREGSEPTGSADSGVVRSPSEQAPEQPTDVELDAGDELDWMFGEAPEPSTPRAAEDLVGRALDDLLGDWARAGSLTRADVSLLATRRALTPTQHGELVELLVDAGVDLLDRPQAGTDEPKPAGHGAEKDVVGAYLREIGRYPLIGANREVELWSLISQGAAAGEQLAREDVAPAARRTMEASVAAGRRAHTELVCANLRLVVSIAKARHYDTSGVEFIDRIQDGNLGLLRAADKFDGSKGFKFSTYATGWIKQSIERGIADRGRTIRIPVHFHEQVQKIKRAITRLTNRLDREPTLTEISDLVGIEPGKIQAALDLTRPCRSLDQFLGDDGDLRLVDVVARDDDWDGRADPAAITVQTMFRRDLEKLLRGTLIERSYCIIARRFGFDTGDEETLDAIAADYGVTRERIRQIQNKALVMLQENKHTEALRSYMAESQ